MIRIKFPATPFDHILMIRVLRVLDHIEKAVVPRDTADILRMAKPGNNGDGCQSIPSLPAGCNASLPI
jgi:hypothetical protein